MLKCIMRWAVAPALALLTVLSLTPSSAQAQMTVEQMEQLDFGFKVFTTEKFDGNGRTCATCHVPEEQYNIAPSDIKKLRGAALKAVLASNVPGLENPTLVKERGLFNVEGFGASDDALDCDHEMECQGPVFRGSMTVGAIALTSVFDPNTPMLGWTGQGSPRGAFHHGFADADADGSTRAFATGAIAQHFPLTLARVPGVDFRRATTEELDAMEAFQNWLGRREQFPISTMTFASSTAEAGKALYLSNQASCQTCHRDGGAGFSPFHAFGIGPVGINIFQHTDVNDEAERLTKLTGVFIPEDEGFNVTPTPDPGGFNIQSLIEAARKEAFFHNHAFINPTRQQKRSKKKGGGVDLEEGGSLEGAITFYFRGDPGFVGSSIHTTLQGLLGGPAKGGDGSGNLHIDDLAEFKQFAIDQGLANKKDDGIEVLGAFIRSLSAFYSVRDCERLVQETIDRIDAGVSPNLPAMHCEFNLDDVSEVIQGAKVSRLYPFVPITAKLLKVKLKFAVRNAARKHDTNALMHILSDLQALRMKIATTPEL